MKKNFIPYNKQFIDSEDIRVVSRVLKSDFLTTGPECLKFERALSNYVGSKYAVAVNNGTSALYLSMLALGISKDDKVITSANTFVADANVIKLVRANVIFYDIDLDTGNLNINHILSLLQNNKKVKAIIAVHFAGYPLDMKKLRSICKKFNVLVVEDGCHALGSSYEDTNNKKYRVGSCKYSDLTTFSFHPIKNITTGEGGAITTNNKKLYETLIQLRTHGITRDNKKLQNTKLAYSVYSNKKIINQWYYESQYLSSNFRITDFQCALGLSQLKKITKFKIKRQKLVREYIKSIDNETNGEISFYNYDLNRDIAYHLFCVQINFNSIKGGRAKIMELLGKDGIGTQVHYIPIYKFPLYRKYHGNKRLLKNTEIHYSRTLSLPLHYSMSLKMPSKIIKSLHKHILKLKK